MTIAVNQAARFVYAFMTRKEAPPFSARHQLERYINDLRLELDWAQQALEAAEKNRKRKSQCKAPR